MTAAEFVGTLFLARDVAHRVHLSTRSYAKHMALGTFYDSVIDLADKFAECCQGRYGLLKDIPLMSAKSSQNIVDFLQSQMDEIEAQRFSICDQKDTPLQNLIDEVVELYLQTLYRLRFLA